MRHPLGQLDLRSLHLATVLLGGGVAWTLHLLGAYLVAEFGCVTAARHATALGITAVAWTLLAISVLMLALAGVATALAYRHARALGGDADETQRFAARLGLWLNSLFAFVIAFESIPIFFYMGSC